MTTLFKSIVKGAVDRALERKPVSDLLRGVLRERGAIFMLHRFECPERGVAGHDPEILRRSLEGIRREGREVLPLRDVFYRLRGEGPPLDGALAFTIDDGYADHAEVAAPVFAAYDVPVTTFVATGFLDGALWFWWDRIEYAVDHAQVKRASLTLGNGEMELRGDTPEARHATISGVVDHCKKLPPTERDALVDRLATALEVDIPSTAPARYAPMTWDDLRSREKGGMSFGPHTVRHPILGRCTNEDSRAEIEGSWKRLSEMASDPEPVFCYPNGQPGDFGPREFTTLRDLGLLGGVSGAPSYAAKGAFAKDATYRYRVPRFPFKEKAEDFRQILTGFSRIKERIREAAGRG